uniref:Uncharacterized protein n=1 Tax=Arundo donax TaxID=35708 RepID=A0A0A9AZK2_ARUDO
MMRCGEESRLIKIISLGLLDGISYFNSMGQVAEHICGISFQFHDSCPN